MSSPTFVPPTNQRSPTKFTGTFIPAQQAHVLLATDAILWDRSNFPKPIGARLELTEVEVRERPEDGKVHVEVVFEIDMDEDMLNSAGRLHGGCSMFMINVVNVVSQAIMTVFHALAAIGTRLRIVNKTTAFGSRMLSARVEIWDMTNRRLVATGKHNRMAPSVLKL